jgi:ABC-type lipoprotein release transport system permease subunit
MKKGILISIVFTLVGFIAGLITAINIFAIDIDVLGIPYSNTAVKAQKDIMIEQGNNKIIIPTGTTLIYNYTAKETPFYSLPIVGYPFDEEPFKETQNWEYFLVHNKSFK